MYFEVVSVIVLLTVVLTIGRSYSVGFCDANWVANVEDRKNTSGGCFFVVNNLVSCFKKKQNSVLVSTADAKYIAVGSSCTQLLWMKQMLEEYNIRQGVMILYCDNMSAINISKNSVQHHRTKHIDIRHHNIRKLIEYKMITLEHVYLLEHIVVPSVADSLGKTVEPSINSVNICDAVSGVDNPEGGSVNVSSADDSVTDVGKQPSVENLGKTIDPSDKDTVDALKESVLIGGDEVRPTVIDTGNVTETRGEPTVGEGVADTLNAEEMKIPEDAGQEKKKSKKRKHKKGVDDDEASEPKKKLSKEERAAKRARRVERKA
ncbi:hypothetical protein LIER_33266 [Lithospermum erythrorhizon]|uniref:Retrovirus-related Pol polyprotein from transposon TNT 1-94 n=1 Tax=Lithospermum erythrorhizon TaxID=34254 RepID=A0AAV3RXY2_LITER